MTISVFTNTQMIMRVLSMFLLLAVSSSRADGLAGVGSMPPLTTKTADHLPLAKKAMEYIDASPDPFHAVQTSINLLEKCGFEELLDGVPYRGKIKAGGKYYFTRNKSTLVAFSIGGNVQPGSGFKVIGGHTDSPNLKVKPRSKRGGAKGSAIQLGVEVRKHLKLLRTVFSVIFFTISHCTHLFVRYIRFMGAVYGIPGLIETLASLVEF